MNQPNQLENVPQKIQKVADLDDQQFKLIKQHFRSQYKQCYKYVAFYLLFSFGKYLACFYSLKQRDNSCDVNPLFVWLTIVGLYEFFNSLRYLAVLYSLQLNAKDIFILVIADMVMKESNENILPPLTMDRLEQRNRRAQLKRIIKERLANKQIPPLDSNLDPPISLWDIMHQAEALNKYTRVMKVYNQFIYYLIFTSGNLAYFSSDSSDCDSQLNNITFVLLLIGYLFSAFLIVGFGLAIISMGLYLPVILFLFLFKCLGKAYRSYNYRNKLRHFDLHIHSENDSRCTDYPQCNICMLDYLTGDKVVKLPCNQKHHFHKDCLRQWLVIKQQCPVCRKLI